MGVPVITADTPAVWEGFRENRWKLCHQAIPRRSLPPILRLLARYPDRRHQVGLAGMKAVHERFNPQVIAQSTAEMLGHGFMAYRLHVPLCLQGTTDNTFVRATSSCINMF